MTDLSDLLARLEAADEGSRQLDGEIFLETHPGQSAFIDVEFIDCIWNGAVVPNGKRTNVPAYTTSLDAITALIAEMLPSTVYRLEEYLTDDPDRREYRCMLISHDSKVYVGFTDDDEPKGPAPVILCIALLRALQARDT